MFIEQQNKKALKKFGLRTLCTKKTFRLSNRTPHAYKIFKELNDFLSSKKYLTLKQLITQNKKKKTEIK